MRRLIAFLVLLVLVAACSDGPDDDYLTVKLSDGGEGATSLTVTAGQTVTAWGEYVRRSHPPEEKEVGLAATWSSSDPSTANPTRETDELDRIVVEIHSAGTADICASYYAFEQTPLESCATLEVNE